MDPRSLARLTAPIAVLSVLLLLVAFVAAWYVRDYQKTASEFTNNHVKSMLAAQELEIGIREVGTQFNRYLITLDKKHLEPVEAMKRRTDAAITVAEDAAATPREQALTQRIRRGYDRFFAEYDKVLQNPKEGTYTRIMDLIDTVLNKEILDPAHEYLQINEGMLRTSSEKNQELAEQLTLAMIALGLCGSVGGMLGGWVIASSIRRSLLRNEERLLHTAQQLDLITQPAPASNPPNGRPRDTIEQVSVSVSAVLKRLRQTERDALRAEQLAWVGQMAAGIAHEIRNPLMAIKLLVQAVADRGSFKPRDLEVLDEEIVRLEQIVTGFLDFARPPRPAPRPVRLGPVVEAVADGVRGRAVLQGVEVAVDVRDDPVVNVDPNQIRQIVFNLLFNALDAQPQGGEVRVSTRADPVFSELAVAVEDRGTGLPPDLGERIFEPFVSTRESGMGLGLSICRRIAETHGGSLTAEDRPGGGAVFTLRLPISAPGRLAPSGKMIGTAGGL